MMESSHFRKSNFNRRGKGPARGDYYGNRTGDYSTKDVNLESDRFYRLYDRFCTWKRLQNCSDEDLDKLLDELNEINFSRPFFKSDAELSDIVKFCCKRISADNAGSVEKLCDFISTSFRGQGLIFKGCLEECLSFILLSLSHLHGSSRLHCSLLRALSVILFKNGLRVQQFYSRLFGPLSGCDTRADVGLLSECIENNDINVISAAVRCLKNITIDLDDESVGTMSQDDLKNVCQHFIKVFRLSRMSTVSEDVKTCHVLLTALQGLHNVLNTFKKSPSQNTIESLLAILHLYMVYGLPGAPSVISNSIQTLTLNLASLSTTPDPQGQGQNQADEDENQPARPSRTKTKGGKSGARISGVMGGGYVGVGISLMDWCGGTSSESESSDSEGVSAEDRVRADLRKKIRLGSLVCLLRLTQVVEKRVMFGYWSLFVPGKMERAHALSTPQTLFSVIASDPYMKARYAALTVLHSLLEGSKQFLHVAEDVEHYRNLTFIPHSVALGQMIKELHAQLFLILSPSNDTTIYTLQALKCMTMLVASVPYHRLRPGLLRRVVNTLYAHLKNRDPDIRVASLTCLGKIVSVNAPLMEVSQIIETSTYQRRITDKRTYHRSFNESADFTASPSNLATDEPTRRSNSNSGTWSPSCYGSSDAPAGPVLSWVVRHCMNNVAPHLLSDYQCSGGDFLSNTGNRSPMKGGSRSDSLNWREAPAPPSPITSSQPIPVQLESLQVLQLLAKGYFPIIIRPHVMLMVRLIECCLSNTQDSAIALHGAKLLHMMSSMLQHCTASMQPDSAPFRLNVGLAVEMWVELLQWLGGLTSSSRLTDSKVVEQICECLANIGPSQVFEQLSKTSQNKIMDKYIEELLSAARNTQSPKMKINALTALANYVAFDCNRTDLEFVVNVSNMLIEVEEKEKNITVRSKIAFCMSNLSDALCNNRTENNEQFMEDYSMQLLSRLMRVSTGMSGDGDKVRCNAVRALGNILLYIPSQYCASARYSNSIKLAVTTVIDNLKSAAVKVQRNACYAVANVFKNSDLQSSIPYFQGDMIAGLVDVLKQSDNIKVRVSAVRALREPSERLYYGSEAQFCTVWSSLLQALTHPLHYTDTSQQNNTTNISTEICEAVVHMTSLISVSDLDDLNPALTVYLDDLSHHLNTYQTDLIELTSSDAGGMSGKSRLDRAVSHISTLRGEGSLTPLQLATLDLLHGAYTLSPLTDDTQDISSQPPSKLPSGFIQSYD